MNKRNLILASVGLIAAAILVFAFWPAQNTRSLRLGLAPYQDLAMIVNIKPLGLEKRYGTSVDLVTLGWEDILPSVATIGRGLDIGFGSYAEYLTKFQNLNKGSNDPVLFIFPLYVFKGGAFVTFKPDFPVLAADDVGNKALATKILAGKIGAQKKSIYEMMVYRLATVNGIDPASVQLIDTPLDQGFIAAQQGSLDLASAGLTQITEAQRRNGRVVFNMDDLKFADFTGFIVKKSVYEARRQDINNVIRMWFDCVNYVYSDPDKNSAESLKYLNSQASTHYSLDEYKQALSQEYLPRSLDEAEREFVSSSGKFPYRGIQTAMIQYLIQQHVIQSAPAVPDFIQP